MDRPVRFLLASDTHLGYLERDPVRGNDSFEAFREVLEIARAQDVDFILLGGDLFHENKPSRATMHRTMAMLREYTFGERAVSVELLSDPHDAQRGYPFPAVNYEDANLNVSIPIFSIHGNHDDPQGSDEHGPLSALDVLAAAGLINYFGRLDLASETSAKRKAQGTDDMIAVRPVLLRKGDTRIALYGMGNIKDERLSYELKAKHVCMYRPAEDPDDWFNLLVVHQNRAAHNPRAFIPESAFDDSVDLVVWGHEHEQRILPEAVSEKNYYISQPGSSIATSLSPGETVEKCVAIVHVDHKDFKIEPIALQSVRPFVMKDISLPTEAAAARLDPSKREDVTKLLRKHVDSLIGAAERAWEERVAAIPQDARRPQPLPLVRLRVAYDTQIPLGNLARFGHEFAGRIANPKDVVQLQLKRSRQARDSSAGHVVRLNKDMIPAEKLERIQLSSLVLENVRLQNFDLLDAAQLQRSVMGYVEKDEYVLLLTQTRRRRAVPPAYP